MNRGNVLALDYGRKRIGLATGDFESKVVFPKGVIENKNFEWVVKELRSFCDDWEVVMIIVGNPMNMDNSKESEMEKEVKGFLEKLKEAFPEKEIELFDERLSSFRAEELIDANSDVFTDKRAFRDSFAAKVILERFFGTAS